MPKKATPDEQLSLLSDSTTTTVHEVTEQPSHEVRQPASITSLSRVRLLKGRDRVIERLRSSGLLNIKCDE